MLWTASPNTTNELFRPLLQSRQTSYQQATTAVLYRFVWQLGCHVLHTMLVIGRTISGEGWGVGAGEREGWGAGGEGSALFCPENTTATEQKGEKKVTEGQAKTEANVCKGGTTHWTQTGWQSLKLTVQCPSRHCNCQCILVENVQHFNFQLGQQVSVRFLKIRCTPHTSNTSSCCLLRHAAVHADTEWVPKTILLWRQADTQTGFVTILIHYILTFPGSRSIVQWQEIQLLITLWREIQLLVIPWQEIQLLIIPWHDTTCRQEIQLLIIPWQDTTCTIPRQETQFLIISWHLADPKRICKVIHHFQF